MAAVVASFLRPEAMVLLFSIVTGLTVWEFTGLVNAREHVNVNRFISTVAAVYFFFAMTYYCSDMYAGIAKSVVFIPYLVTIIYLLVAELYLKQDDPIQDWAYTMLPQFYIALPFSLLNVLAFNATSEGFVTIALLAAQRAGIQRHQRGLCDIQYTAPAERVHLPLGQRLGRLLRGFADRSS